jgi:vacuolar protein sorting-associated protein 13A/C
MTVQQQGYHQLLFHVDFKVGVLQASLFKSVASSEKPLGGLKLEGFSLMFGLAEHNMNVNVQLR